MKSFARIHMANLINAGIIPMTFADESDYDKIDMLDELKIENLIENLKSSDSVIVKNVTKGVDIKAKLDLSERQRAMLIAGGLLNYTREKTK